MKKAFGQYVQDYDQILFTSDRKYVDYFLFLYEYLDVTSVTLLYMFRVDRHIIRRCNSCMHTVNVHCYTE
jgi:hypothetical protein